MEYSNLRPITSTAQAKHLGYLGGSVSSPRKRLAAQLRELKKKGEVNNFYKRLELMMEDPYYSSFEILVYIQETRELCKTPYEKIALINVWIKWSVMHFGKKERIEYIQPPVDWKEILDSCIIKDD